MAHKPSRTRLKIDNAAETVPRVIHGGGRTPDRGEWGLVLRPLTRQGLLVLVPKDGSPRAWRGEAHSDAVAMPKGAVASVEAEVAAIKTMLSDELGPVGAIALRGEWRAWMTCSPDGPLVELERKLAYVTIRVWNEGKGWSWQITRSPRWFAEPRQSPVQSTKQLSAAVLAAVRTATDLAAEACSQRDTRRRGALDDGYTGTRGAAVPSKTRAGRGLSEDWSPGTKAPRKSRAGKATSQSKPRTPALAVVRDSRGINYNDDDTAEKRANLSKYILHGLQAIGKLAPPPPGSTLHARGLVEGFLLQNQWPGKVIGGRKVRGQDRYTVDVDVPDADLHRRWMHFAAALDTVGMELSVNGVVPVLDPLGVEVAQAGKGILTSDQLWEATAKEVVAWNANRDERSAEGWAHSALHHMGLNEAELETETIGHRQVVVRILNLDDELSSGTRDRVLAINGSRPVGLYLEHEASGIPVGSATAVHSSVPMVAPPMAEEAKAVADAAMEILDAIDRGEAIGRPVRSAPVQNALAFLRAMFKSDHPTPWILEGWLFDGKISGDKASVDDLMEELDNAVKGKKRAVPADWAERGRDLRAYLEATPRWTWRTRKLITRARELVDEPSCRAPERVAVAEAIQKAADALSRARGDASRKEALQVLGFSALRLASDCAAGQRALFGGPAPAPAPAPKAEPKPAPKRSPRVTKRSRPSNASATQASPQATAPKPARKPRAAPSTKVLTQAQKDAAIGQAMKSSMDDALAKLLGGAR